jgi:hypothetical protein
MPKTVTLPSMARILEEEARRSRARHLLDPVAWVRERCDEHLWSSQRRIMQSVWDVRRTAVPTSHAIGKSFTAARTAVAWIDVHQPGEAFVVTTATTESQVKAVLWKEIGRAHAKAGSFGRLNQTEWWVDPVLPGGKIGKEEIVAFGRKPAAFNPTAFHGIHAPKVLVIIDEAGGVPEPLWVALSGLITNDASRMLAIGNPTDPQGHFARVCRPGSGWNVIHVSAFDTPVFTKEDVPPSVIPNLIGRSYVEEARIDWAPTWTWTEDGSRVVPPADVERETSASPMWFAKILGEFPAHASDSLIPMGWLQAAVDRWNDPPDGERRTDGPNELGVDVGGGNDRSVIAHRRGCRAQIIKRTNTPDTMQTAGHVVTALSETGASIARVDIIGIGRGVVDRGRERKARVIGVNVAEQARDKERFANRRAELFWGLRMRFQQGDIDLDPRDQALLGQLGALKYKTNSRGQIVIESKDEMRKRGLPSPDDADAVMLAFAAGDRRERGPVVTVGAKTPIVRGM